MPPGHDGIVFRAAIRRISLLDPIDAIMSNADVVSRAIAVWERRDELPPPPPALGRGDLLNLMHA